MSGDLTDYSSPEYLEEQAKLKERYDKEQAQAERVHEQFFRAVNMLGRVDGPDALIRAAKYCLRCAHRMRDITPSEQKELKELAL